jgi:hypothetical protein
MLSLCAFEEPFQDVTFRAPPGFRWRDEWLFARARLEPPGLLACAPFWFPLDLMPGCCFMP